MNRRVLLDTGPLVALLSDRDQHHGVGKAPVGPGRDAATDLRGGPFGGVLPPAPTPGGSAAVMELLRRSVVEVAFHLGDHAEPIAHLLRKYANVPMSLADGCLVRMAEISAGSTILTLDRDFRLYRKSGRQVVPVIMPGES